MTKISAKGNKLMDDQGRTRIFHGMNMVFKGEYKEESGKKEYIADWTLDDFVWLKDNGFNLVRLGLIWAGLEPTIGDLDEAYLDWLEIMITYCKQNDIYVFLDMHQDLFAEKYSDGAPDWATFDEGLDHYEGEIWSDAYLFSDAVKGSFDHFWDNKKLENGVGVQDHFASLWGTLAKRFIKHTNVIGFDVFNEPFPGSPAMEIFGTLLGAYGQLTQKDMSVEELMGLFLNEEKKLELLMDIDDYELYSQMTGLAGEASNKFDQTKLLAFYKKVSKAIRRETSQGFIMIENNYFSNMGIPSDLEGLEGESYVFAPHGYDLVVDSPAVAIASNQRVDLIFDRHKAAGDKLNMPVIVGEWGAHYEHSEGLEHIKHILGVFDKNHWSHTYWCYTNNIARSPVFEVLKRAYPIAVAGKIESYSYNYAEKSFSLSWENTGSTAVTEIFLPGEVEEVTTEASYKIEIISQAIRSSVVQIQAKQGERQSIDVKLKGV